VFFFNEKFVGESLSVHKEFISFSASFIK